MAQAQGMWTSFGKVGQDQRECTGIRTWQPGHIQILLLLDRQQLSKIQAHSRTHKGNEDSCLTDNRKGHFNEIG